MRTARACATGSRPFPGVTEARGTGLLLGAVLDRPAQPVVDAALDAGLVCLSAGPDVLRFAPPLVVGADEIDLALEILTEVMAGSVATAGRSEESRMAGVSADGSVRS